MNKSKTNLPLGISVLLFTITSIFNQNFSIPHVLYFTLLVFAVVLEIWGIILLSQSPAIKNGKLRKWKLNILRKIIGRNNSR